MKVRFDAGMAIMLLFLGLWFIGCDQADNPVMNSENESILAAPSSWHTLSDAQRNQKILDEAKKWEGKQGGQCKTWVQTVVTNASGGLDLIPINFSGGGTYHLAKWDEKDSRFKNVQMVWQGAYMCLASFPSSLRPGQIIQLRWGPCASPSSIIGQPHTAIIKSVSSSSMEWWDSNFIGPNKVGYHLFPAYNWYKVEAWTVYQIK